MRYPPGPPTVEEIIAVMRAAGDGADALRLRGVIVVPWRAGLRISEAIALQESDLDRTRGAVLVRRGKGGKRREVGMTGGPGRSSRRGSRSAPGYRSAPFSAWSGAPPAAVPAPHPGFASNSATPPAWPGCAVGSRRTSSATPTRLEMSREGVPLVVIQRQLGHADSWITSAYLRGIGITSAYLRGIDNTEIIHAVHERPAPTIPADNGFLSLG